jgi:hypothetical protein
MATPVAVAGAASNGPFTEDADVVVDVITGRKKE